MLDFERFYFNTKNFLYQYLYQHVCDFFETEDIAQEAYLTALEEWDELQKHPNPMGWLLQTAKNLVTQTNIPPFTRMAMLFQACISSSAALSLRFLSLVMYLVQLLFDIVAIMTQAPLIR